MARKLAPTKLTSGAGFPFEERVAAYYLSCLLSGEAPFGEDFGVPIRVDFQTRVLGWLLDDILITFESGRRLALSIKSNEQINTRSFPTDFVRDCWELYLHEGTDCWNAETDYLGLATSPRSPDTNTSIRELLQWARDQDEERFLEQVASNGVSSASKRNLVASLQCPSDLSTKYGVGKRDAVRLLRRLRFPSFDFQDDPSEDEAQAVRRCREVVRSGDIAEAKDVWGKLQKLVSVHRQSGGFIDRDRVLEELLNRHDLKPWPKYAEDMASLHRWTHEALESIPDKIGLTVQLERNKDVIGIAEEFSKSSFVALRGASGCGKTVVAKQFVARLPEKTPVLWLDGKRLTQWGVSELQVAIGLRHPFAEFSSALPVGSAYCVVDGAGGISSDTGYRTLASLIKILKVGDPRSPWRLLLVCQQEEWNRMFAELAHAVGRTLPWQLADVGKLSANDLGVVWGAFPQLLPLARRHDLSTILFRPKVLDMVARKITHGDTVDAANWVGESSIALWHWETEIIKASAPITRAQTTLAVAESQADALQPSIAISSLLGDGETLDKLVQDRILNVEANRVSFQHDLYGDWARLQVLLTHQDQLPDFVDKKLLSPYWNRAVRLYGIFLLEQKTDASYWKAAIDRFNDASVTGNLAQDLILESVIFASNPEPLLEIIWPELQDEGGKLLRRLLGRFLYAATQPDNRRTALAQSPVDELRYSTENRIPYYPYWAPMLRFIYAHKEDVARLATHLTAEIVNKWLRIPLTDIPMRKEAADIALLIAEQVLAQEWEYGAVSDDTKELAFTAALAAIHELPNEVRSFALRAAGRIARAQPPERDFNEASAQRQTLPSYTLRKRENVSPWPDGPMEKQNESFRKICFAGDALSPVILSNPDLAGEILLALLIEPPRKYDIEGDYIGRQNDTLKYGITDELHGHYPPFYWHFPWLLFIRHRPEQAIDTIVKLVNFASQRWQETCQKWYSVLPSVEVKVGKQTSRWAGDGQCYYWYTGTDGSHVVSSVLMTLEYWLYECLDANENVDSYLHQILEQSQSVALGGVLASVACKHEHLLKGVLQPLMGVPEFLYLERQKALDRFATTAGIAWSGESQATIKYFRDWISLEHRAHGMDEAARRLLLTDSGTRTFFAAVRKQWQKQSNSLRRKGYKESADDLDRLRSGFTPEHYKVEYSEEHSGLLISHEFPEALEDIKERAQQASDEALASLQRMGLPMRCRRLLDREETLSSSEELEKFWIDSQHVLSTFSTTENADDISTGSRSDASCGAAALLLLHHEKWLKSYPERFSWCREEILRTIENPPKPGIYDSEVDASIWNWHSFCAEAISVIWRDALSDQRVRHCVSLMVLDHHYQTVTRLFASCHQLRRDLGEQFIKVQALLRHWARERFALHRREDALNRYIPRPDERHTYRTIIESEEVADRLLSNEFRRLVSAFVDDTLPAWLPSLLDNDLVTAAPEWDYSWGQNDRERKRRSVKTDITLIKAAYSYLPDLAEAHDSLERAQWIEIWKELLEFLLFTLRPTKKEDADKEVNGTPYDYDYWILTCTALLITQVNEQEQLEDFWQPILDLGGSARYWVEHFLSNFFSYNLHKTDAPGFRHTYVARWKQMIAYCDKHKKAKRLGGVWEHLMGLAQFVDPWDEKYLGVITEMRPEFQLYCEKHLRGDYPVARFVRFLRRPAARSIRLDGLTWIEHHIDDLNDYSVQRAKVEEALSILLAECWQSHREEMRQKPAVMGCFTRLVKRLADNQNPVALEIQNRIIAG